MKLFPLFTLALTLSASAFASPGATQYNTFQELQNADFYRVACSNSSREHEVHVLAEVSKQKLVKLEIVTVVPTISFNHIELTPVDKAQFKLTNSSLSIEGTFPGSYFDQDLTIDLKQGKDSFTGTVRYDDNDGLFFDEQVVCHAVTYLIG
jgi:hypothetical protein